MAHKRRALMLVELGIVAALGVGGAGCQTSALTSTAGEAIRTDRLEQIAAAGALAPPTTPQTAPAPGAFDRHLLEPPPTVRGVNPGLERTTEIRTAPGVIGPQTVLSWTVESGESQGPPFSGQDVVHADGQVSLGPYGSVTVSGLTAQQASHLLARHLSRWIRSPRVRLAVSQRRPGDTTASASGFVPVARPAQQPAVQQTRHTVAPPVAVPASRGPALGSPSGKAMTIAATQGQATPGGLVLAAEPEKSKDATEEAPKPTPVAGPSTTGYPVPPTNHLPGAPTELKKVTLPPYVIEPPDVLIVEAVNALPDQDIRGQTAVRPDGTIGLGIYGSVYVAGKTLEQARDAIYRHLTSGPDPRLSPTKVKPDSIYVDVLAYNSKVYYVITDGAGYGEQVYRIPITGSETVLDAVGQINGLPPVASKKKIWVARRSAHGHQVLPVDWDSIAKGGSAATNWQIMPGDRVYVNSNPWVRADTAVQRFLSPFERILGAMLLGSQTVNSLKGQGLGTGGGINP
jgi:polysaccharide biosynthesis/export protein